MPPKSPPPIGGASGIFPNHSLCENPRSPQNMLTVFLRLKMQIPFPSPTPTPSPILSPTQPPPYCRPCTSQRSWSRTQVERRRKQSWKGRMWVEGELALLPEIDPGNPTPVGDGIGGIHFLGTQNKPCQSLDKVGGKGTVMALATS